MGVDRVKCFDIHCQDYFVSIYALRQHAYIKNHSSKMYVCRVNDECSRKFDIWNSYRKHLITQHGIPNHLHNNSKTQFPQQNDNNCQTVFENSQTQNDIQFGSQDHLDVSTFDPNEFRNILLQNATRFIAKLYNKPAFPRNLVDEMVKDITSFLSDTFAVANYCKIIKALELVQVNPEIINALCSIFNGISNPFSGMSSEYLRLKFFQSIGDYIPPETYVIDSRVERTFTDGSVKGKMKQVTGQFVPLRKVLKKFFELPDALSSTLKYMRNLKSSDVISNIIQCQKFQTIERQFYSPNDKIIPIIIYYDDWEPNNALGPHSEKIGSVYANLPTLPEECQSKLDNIFEVLLFNADDRKSYGNKKIFRPLVQELQYLEREGVLINTSQGEERVYFPTILLIGDNLGINSMCGFVESFSATYMCRFCKATKSMTERMTIEDQSCLRDSNNYLSDLALDDFTKTGIKEEFVFKDVKTLCCDNICNAYAVDCMHDGPEGIGHYTMIPVLKHLLDLDPLSLQTLNYRMYAFDYGPDISNKPPSITREISGRGAAYACSEGEGNAPKSCCGRPPLRLCVLFLGVVGACLVAAGAVLGALRPHPKAPLTLLLLMIGIGVVLVTAAGLAWRLGSRDAPCTFLGLRRSSCRRLVPRLPPSYARPHHPYAAMLYPEFHYRPPPPTYQASMQEYRLRLLLLDRSVPAVSPPPTYRSNSATLVRGTTGAAWCSSEYSGPPSYRTPQPTPTVTITDPPQNLTQLDVKYPDDEPIHSIQDQEKDPDEHLVTIVHTEAQPVIVTVSGSMTDNPAHTQPSSEIDILAHL